MSSGRININMIWSSSEEDGHGKAAVGDEKKRKRMISNRESARRSRMKREQHMKDLNEQIAYLRFKSGEMGRKIEETGRRYAAVEAENRRLRMHAEELNKRLRLLEASYSSSSTSVVEDEDADCFLRDVLQDFELKPSLQPPPFLHSHSHSHSHTLDGIYLF